MQQGQSPAGRVRPRPRFRQRTMPGPAAEPAAFAPGAGPGFFFLYRVCSAVPNLEAVLKGKQYRVMYTNSSRLAGTHGWAQHSPGSQHIPAIFILFFF